MKKNDWIGIGVSAALHALLLLMLAFVTGATPDTEPLGYIEVDFGPISQGRPVQRAPEKAPEVTRPEPEPEPEVEEQSAPPEVAKPVDLPDQPQIVDRERVQTPETEQVAPVEAEVEAPVEKPEPQPNPRTARPSGGGATTGTTGASTGDDGEGADEEKAAPYQIEGLNRNVLRGPLPNYAEKVNAVIQVRIAVAPDGQIVQRIPLRKGNPSLERAVMEALQRWRFNPLPTNVPQENQIGTVTFRFRLE